MARSNATTNLREALTELQETVSWAFKQEPGYPRIPVNERERYAAALVAVARFFSGFGRRQIENRFFELASAIADLNMGTVHPVLRPVRADNRRADPSQLWRARAQAALGLEALIRSGLSPNATAAHIAKGIPGLAKLASAKAKQSKPQSILLGWRREFRAARIKNFEATELFSEGMGRMKRLKRPHLLRKFAAEQLSRAVSDIGVLSPHS
jgi:hypothetical protein